MIKDYKKEPNGIDKIVDYFLENIYNSQYLFDHVKYSVGIKFPKTKKKIDIKFGRINKSRVVYKF